MVFHTPVHGSVVSLGIMAKISLVSVNCYSMFREINGSIMILCRGDGIGFIVRTCLVSSTMVCPLYPKYVSFFFVCDPSLELLVFPSLRGSSCFPWPGSDVMNVASCEEPFFTLIPFDSICLWNSFHITLSLPVFESLSRNIHMVVASGK